MIKRIINARKRFREYIYDPTINIKDRVFILLSTEVLIALFAAVPCGLIMQEPLTATVSTFVSAVFFTIYVIYSFKKNRIARAKVAISVILVFFFLPAMLFTNGGINSGAPIWLLLGTFYIALILDGKIKIVMLILNVISLTVCWIVGYLYPEFVAEYSRGGNYFDTLAALFIVGTIIYVMTTFQSNLFRKEGEQKNLRRLFEQTATSLVNAIDAKDEYTHGHSARVAEYSRRIAECSGMSPEECNDVYYAALLHDVGKIGVPENIINKKGKLTDEEFDIVKQHPLMGVQILNGISEFPSLSIGARYHHERYDGKGYPEHLKGEDIPKLARIISVADAYDAMTSKRSYRNSIPQHTVREEIIKGSGTQFDPECARIMQFLIDMDTDFIMREKKSTSEVLGQNELICKTFRTEVSKGIILNPYTVNIRLKCTPAEGHPESTVPAFVLFDSLDGRVHDNEREQKELNYFEFAEIWFDGRYNIVGARKIQVEETNSRRNDTSAGDSAYVIYDVEAVKRKDHMLIKIDNGIKLISLIIASPNSSRYAYVGFTGDNCMLSEIQIDRKEEMIPEDYIPKIAEEISYIDVPAGDIPNIQVDGYRTDSSEGIPVTDGLVITFHTMTLPTGWLVWHCPYVDIFYSDDKRPDGENYKEYALIRLDGESWEADRVSENKLIVNKGEEFNGWDAWKEVNKKGYNCTVTFRCKDDKIITITENNGIAIKNITKIIDPSDEVYASLTGDQVAITNVRITGTS